MPVVGTDVTTSAPVSIGQTERRSGLYILGKPGMGKSTLLVNLITQDIDRLNSVFFLDPHGEAIFDTIHCKPVVDFINEYNQVRLLNPADETHSFGINPLECANVESLSARQHALNKTLNVFRRLWGQDNLWGVYLERILQSALPIFIEVQDYTLSEMPLFLTNASFRRHVLERVQYNIHLLDYWQYEFKPEQAQSALNRIGILLSNPYVRDVIGQKDTTVDFPAYAKWGFAVFLHLPTTIDLEARRFIGTIFLSELFHALYSRPEEAKQHNFGLYVDEFQQFATDQFADFILEGRKFGVATTIAHQERVGQFGENQKILGATMACANKVIYQVTPRDARELAPEFAEKPVALETRLVPEMVICKDPMWHLLQTGHNNPRIMELYRAYLEPFFIKLTKLKDEADTLTLQRSGHFDQALLSRDYAGLSGIQQENRMNAAARGRDIPVSYAALDRSEAFLHQAMQQHGLAEKVLFEMGVTLRAIQAIRREIREIESIFIRIMETCTVPAVGTETLALFLVYTMNSRMANFKIHDIYELYILVKYGDPQVPRDLSGYMGKEKIAFIRKYLYKMAEELYMARKTNILLEINADPNNRYKYSEETILKYIQEHRDDFARGYHFEQNPGHGPDRYEDLHYPDLYFGILSDEDRAYLERACYETICENPRSDRFFQGIEDMLEFCQLLAQPENHILVASGQYVEKPVQIASTQEMTNQAIQTLTDLPRFHALAKTIQEQDGRQEVWKGKISTSPPPPMVNDRSFENQITQITHEKCCKPRSEIAKEIIARRQQWRSTGGGDDAPPSRIM